MFYSSHLTPSINHSQKIIIATPLIPEEGDPRWDFVRNVLRVFEKRKMRKIVSKHGVKPLSEAITMLKVVILAMCFETDITFVNKRIKG